MIEVRSPRAVFIDHPAGRTFGPPGDPKRHEQVLGAALSELPHFTAWGQIRDLCLEWQPGNRSFWEIPLREELLRPALSGLELQQLIRLRKQS
jgi:hypothetical protein